MHVLLLLRRKQGLASRGDLGGDTGGGGIEWGPSALLDLKTGEDAKTKPAAAVRHACGAVFYKQRTKGRAHQKNDAKTKLQYCKANGDAKTGPSELLPPTSLVGLKLGVGEKKKDFKRGLVPLGTTSDLSDQDVLAELGEPSQSSGAQALYTRNRFSLVRRRDAEADKKGE
jgi:hypothetical protein